MIEDKIGFDFMEPSLTEPLDRTRELGVENSLKFKSVLGDSSPQAIAVDGLSLNQVGVRRPIPMKLGLEDRQNAMKELLDKLNERAGVLPEEFVKAFGKLDSEQLKLPPNQTIEGVIEELGLEGQRREEALKLYGQFIAKVEKSPTKEKSDPNLMQLGLGGAAATAAAGWKPIQDVPSGPASGNAKDAIRIHDQKLNVSADSMQNRKNLSTNVPSGRQDFQKGLVRPENQEVESDGREFSVKESSIMTSQMGESLSQPSGPSDMAMKGGAPPPTSQMVQTEMFERRSGYLKDGEKPVVEGVGGARIRQELVDGERVMSRGDQVEWVVDPEGKRVVVAPRSLTPTDPETFAPLEQSSKVLPGPQMGSREIFEGRPIAQPLKGRSRQDSNERGVVASEMVGVPIEGGDVEVKGWAPKEFLRKPDGSPFEGAKVTLLQAQQSSEIPLHQAPQAHVQQLNAFGPNTASVQGRGAFPMPVVSSGERDEAIEVGDNVEFSPDSDLKGQQMMGRSEQRDLQIADSVTKAFAATSAANRESSVDPNVSEVVQRAQILARGGGGEMRIQLNPPDLGQVNLRVVLEGGQVQVEMVTETQEAKKLLEKGVSELKSSLAAHRIHLDDVKIGLSSSVSENMERNFSNHQDQQQRQNAHDFLSQFRDGNNDRRGGMFEDRDRRAFADHVRRGQDRMSSQSQPTSRTGGGKGRKSQIHYIA